MGYPIIFHPIAETELIESSKWYAEKSNLVFQKFSAEIESLTSIIQNNPIAFQIAFKNKRKANLKYFPFSNIYVSPLLEKTCVF